MELVLAFLWLAGGLLVLIYAAGKMTHAAEQIGAMLGWSPILIGVLILAPGTSLPELASSLVAVFKGTSEIVAGNLVGSNITNICLILGLAAMIPSKILTSKSDLLQIELPAMLASSIFLIALGMNGTVDRFEAIIVIIAYFGYAYYSVKINTNGASEKKKALSRKIGWKIPVLLIISAAGVALGAQWTIDSVLRISKLTGYSSETLAASLIALGTSLPELVVTLRLVFRGGEAGSIIGNIIGSNIFNATIGIGVPALFGSVIYSQNIYWFTLGLFPITVFYVFVVYNREVNRGEGILLLGLYLLFIKLLILG